MTIIEFPPTPTSTSTSTWAAPTRFDVHNVAAVGCWVDANAVPGAHLDIDLSACVFVDRYAVEALEAAERQAHDTGATFAVSTLSLAAQVTFELLAGAPAELALAA